MWLHFSIFCSLIILGIIYKPRNKMNRWFYFSILFLLFFVIASFRAINIGNDTQEYFRIFRLISSSNSLTIAIGLTRYEIGYITLNYIISRFTSNFSVLLCLVSAFYLFSVFRFIKKYASKIGIVVILCFTFFMFYDVMNIIRQCISVAIFLFAIDYLLDRKFVKYFCLIILATFFQSISLVLLLIYFIPKADFKKAKDLVKWIFVVVIALIILGSLSRIVGVVFPYFAHYFTTEYAEGGVRSASLVFFLIRIGIVVFVWLLGGFRTNQDLDIKSNIFMQMMLLDCLIAGMSISFNILDRIENFFCLGYIIAISNGITRIKRSNQILADVIIIIFSFIYMTILLIYRSNWYGLFPYQFL